MWPSFLRSSSFPKKLLLTKNKDVSSIPFSTRSSLICPSSSTIRFDRYDYSSLSSSPAPAVAGVRSFSSTSFEASSRSSSSSTSSIVPGDESVNVVIVGGGIIGTSVAYHLSKLGIDNVLLLERDRLTSGTTWHAAGLVNTFGSMSRTSTWMRRYTRDLYARILPKELDDDLDCCGFKPIGLIELACDTGRLESYRRIAALNRLCGVDVEEITPERVQELMPLCRVDDVLAGFYVPSDGRANPTDATMAFAKAARRSQRGKGNVEIREHCPVAGVTKTSNPNGVGPPSVSGVVLETGQVIHANVVVNCTGMWARQFGEICGIRNIPNQAAEHYYLITGDLTNSKVDNNIDFDPSWPVVEDSSRCIYIRPEGSGLMLGFFEWEGAPWNTDTIPSDFTFGEIQPDWDRMMPYIEHAFERLHPSVMEHGGIKTLFCGPESFTPDNGPAVGHCSSYLKNYYVAAGMNSIGILSGGGIGYILSKWIAQNGCPPNDIDITGINVDRFHEYQRNPKYRAERVSESLGTTYKIHYPVHEYKTCRNVKHSPLHDRLTAPNVNAFFRDVSGWESPAFYNVDGGPNDNNLYGHSFDRESWFPLWEAEHLNCRTNVSLFDMSFMSKFLVQGKDAGAFLNRLSTANIDPQSQNEGTGTITYTQWLNEDGYMEADLTITKLPGGQSFLVIATDTMHNHVYNHMIQRIPANNHVFVTDVTGRYAQINIQGPKSRDLLQRLTSYDVQDDSFPFRHVADIDIDYARVLCTRITYVGELGYELFVPVEQAKMVYDRIVQIGMDETNDLRLAHAGLKALGSLRLEKGYRDYGHDMDNTDTILECGLGFTCDFEKTEAFIGQQHVLEQKRTAKERGGLHKRMVNILLKDPEPLLHSGEVLWRNGKRITEIRSASYGHSLGGAVGLAMLESHDVPITKRYIDEGGWVVEIADRRTSCSVSLAPFFDPKSLRVKG